MKIGIMLRHAEQHHGGVLVYTHNLVREMLALETPHEFVLLYQNPRLIGIYADGDRVREITQQAPSALAWDQLVVPWLDRKEHFDVIFNPKFTVPFLSKYAGHCRGGALAIRGRFSTHRATRHQRPDCN